MSGYHRERQYNHYQVSTIQTSFPVEGLLRQENFISLLYYLGLLTFGGEKEGRPLLKIPNRTVQQLMYSYSAPRRFVEIPLPG